MGVRPEAPFVAFMATKQEWGTFLVKKWLDNGKALVCPLHEGRHGYGYTFDERTVDVLFIWERLPVPLWLGTPEAIEKMYEKIAGFTPKDIQTIQKSIEACGGFDPREFWDREGFIGNLTWTDAIANRLQEIESQS